MRFKENLEKKYLAGKKRGGRNARPQGRSKWEPEQKKKKKVKAVKSLWISSNKEAVGCAESALSWAQPAALRAGGSRGPRRGAGDTGRNRWTPGRG